jgi:hypothetical protein
VRGWVLAEKGKDAGQAVLWILRGWLVMNLHSWARRERISRRVGMLSTRHRIMAHVQSDGADSVLSWQVREERRKKERNCTVAKDPAGCWMARLRVRALCEMVLTGDAARHVHGLDPVPSIDPADANGWIRYRGQHGLVPALCYEPDSCSAAAATAQAWCVPQMRRSYRVARATREMSVLPRHGHAQSQGLIGWCASRIRKAAFTLPGLQLLARNRPQAILVRGRGSGMNSASCPTVCASALPRPLRQDMRM